MTANSSIIYEHWDPTRPISLSRSRLYSLYPVRSGTCEVESLTGYVARLAEAHHVQPGSLIANEFTYLVKHPSQYSYLHGMSNRTEALNGTGQMALDFVRAVKQLTLQNDIHCLTFLPWAEVLPPRELWLPR